MKRLFVSVLFCVGFLFSFSQQGTNNNLQQVKVNDWNNNMAFFVADDAWSQGEDTLVKQMGFENFKKIKFYSKHDNMPGALLMWHPGKQPRKIPLDEYEKRLSSLKVYKVAVFNIYYKGNRFPYIIVAAPYQDLYWDKTAKWDTVYFAVREGAVVPS